MNQIAHDTNESSASLDAPGLGRELLRDHLLRAAEATAPMWSVDRAVAVNPFCGLGELDFDEAARRSYWTAGARLTMPRAHYREAYLNREFGDEELLAAAEHAPARIAAAGLAGALERLNVDSTPLPRPLATCSDLLVRNASEWRGWSLPSDPAVAQIAGWAEGYFDHGQSAWSHPWADRSVYSAWRAESALDRGPEIAGIRDFRRRVALLSDNHAEAAEWASQMLELSPTQLDMYFARLAMTMPGWAGYVRHLGWHEEGERALAPVAEFLTVRLVWDAIVLESGGDSMRRAWRRAKLDFATPPSTTTDFEFDLLFHRAFELGKQRAFVSRSLCPDDGTEVQRPKLQAAFCIDVRSERLRRALEALDPGIETVGIAGFFGVAIEALPNGGLESRPHCPALVPPAHRVLRVDRSEENSSHPRHRAFASLRSGAASGFAYVESLGLGYAAALLRNAFDGMSRHERRKASAFELECSHDNHDDSETSGSGIPFENQLGIARGVLRTFPQGHELAPIVLLCGHGAHVRNNATSAALQCGACGGQAGDVNATVAAQVLSDPRVREALAAEGTPIPADTRFIPALHETVTDEILLLEIDGAERVSSTEREALHAWLKPASAAVRRERAASLGLDPKQPDLDEAFARRGRDWSELRPEWGLAGCNQLIVAPRRRTRQFPLDGRAFLHDYDAAHDPEGSILEQIMTAPLVVASWISLQYFASTVAPQTFGSGDKAIHNIIGRLGVAEGRDDDLRVGLPLQCTFDDEGARHEAQRLIVAIEAPVEAIDRVLKAHPAVEGLFARDWARLYTIAPDGSIDRHYGPRGWESAASMFRSRRRGEVAGSARLAS